MDRRETRESVNSGCNCLIISVIVLALVISCARSLINGDIKLPRFGSSHVSGGSGSYGTSNGYNVNYKQTTAPNSNSSLRDYTHTNSQPTENREGSNLKLSNTNAYGKTSSSSSSGNNSSPVSGSFSSSSSSINTISNKGNSQKSKTYYKTCSLCDGTGKRRIFHMFNENIMGTSCYECGRTDTHHHDETITCEACSGEGKILMEKVNGPLGEMEVRHFDW